MDSANSNSQFEVFVSSDTFKFNAAHFVAFQNYRERLHGHNYNVSVKLIGGHRNKACSNIDLGSSMSTSLHTPILGADGYLIDFTIVKQVTRQICKELNEHFLCPLYSDVLDISTITKPQYNSTSTETSSTASETTEYIQIECTMDHTKFTFPKNDCVLLPIVHATAEELAIYIYCQIINQITSEYLLLRNIHTMEVTVAEAPTQQATFRHAIPTLASATSSISASSRYNIDVRQFIMSGNIVPMPCLSSSVITTTTSPEEKNGTTGTATARQSGATTESEAIDEGKCQSIQCNCCGSSNNFQLQLQRVVDAINDGRLLVATTSQPDSMNQNNSEENSHKKTPENRVTIQDVEQLLKS